MKRPEQVARNRDLLLDAARRVFLARGYAGASLDAIADKAASPSAWSIRSSAARPTCSSRCSNAASRRAPCRTIASPRSSGAPMACANCCERAGGLAEPLLSSLSRSASSARSTTTADPARISMPHQTAGAFELVAQLGTGGQLNFIALLGERLDAHRTRRAKPAAGSEPGSESAADDDAARASFLTWSGTSGFGSIARGTPRPHAGSSPPPLR